MKAFYRQKEVVLISKKKEKKERKREKLVGYCKVTFLWWLAEVCQANYLASADQAISD